VRRFFEEVLNQLKIEEEVMFQRGLLLGLQDKIESFEDITPYMATSDFRNPLMDQANDIRGRYELRLYEIIELVADSLLDLIDMDDETILKMDTSYFKDHRIEFPKITAEAYGVITQDNVVIV
jgi:hypothetical protein